MPLLGIYPKKTIIQKHIIQVLIAALFTIARTWKQPKCPSAEECIKKIWHIYTKEYYSVVKKNEAVSLADKWMDLRTVIQSEVKSKRERQISYINIYMWNL